MKEKLFTIDRKDFRVDTFRAGGKGGQHQNKTSSGVRITHIPSGISAESRESRHQHENKTMAFLRLANDKKFIAWYKLHALDHVTIEKNVDAAMQESNLRVELKKDGKWTDDNDV
jgi:hypothetical protein